MLPNLAFEILLASAFTFGCAAIHEWREHVQLLTPILARTAGYMVLFIALVALAKSDPPNRTVRSLRPATRTAYASSQ